MSDHIGTLILDAEAKAKKKAGRVHTSEAECHCQVTVSWLPGDHSRMVKIERCPEHPKPQPEKRHR